MAFADCVVSSTTSLLVQLYVKPLPKTLYQYTRSAADILASRSLWATCLTNQKDTTELTHAIEWVDEEAQRMCRTDIPVFNATVLPLIAKKMQERRQWVYLACFCDEEGSTFHWEKFGPQRLGMPFSGINRLRCADFRAEHRFQPVIYDYALQRAAIKDAMLSISNCITRYTDGSGDKAGWYAASCARDAAQLMLGLAAGMKSEGMQRRRSGALCVALALQLLTLLPMTLIMPSRQQPLSGRMGNGM